MRLTHEWLAAAKVAPVSNRAKRQKTGNEPAPKVADNEEDSEVEDEVEDEEDEKDEKDDDSAVKKAPKKAAVVAAPKEEAAEVESEDEDDEWSIVLEFLRSSLFSALIEIREGGARLRTQNQCSLHSFSSKARIIQPWMIDYESRVTFDLLTWTN